MWEFDDLAYRGYIHFLRLEKTVDLLVTMTAIYDRIGDDYDTTRRADPVIVEQLKDLLGVQRDKRYLDVACGTGNYTAEISRAGGIWHAFDQSKRMLHEARPKSNLVEWDQFDVEHLGYESEQFDGAMCSLAIHHFPSLTRAFSEVARVLRSRARLVVFTAIPEQMRSYWLCHYFPVMMEKSCEQMPAFEDIEGSLLKGGLTLDVKRPFFISRELQDSFLYSGKQRPEMYLSEKVRNGISSFRNFCTRAELRRGLGELQADIASGAISEIIDGCRNPLGDYLFVRAIKHRRQNGQGI